jgi:serine/threonine-protein kinase
MVGQTVGKYRVVSRLGRGGMGSVYKAVDETLGREVAIKCLNAELTDPDLLKRFRAEAVALARLNHPNIATLFELGDHHGQMMMVMEFVRGETFDRVSQREGPMEVTRAAQLCAQVLDALDHAHRSGIVHRDLKPANLMLTPAGLVKVMDFGLARMIGTEHLTNDGYMVGTPAYMSPEQVLGRDIDGRADLYAMGVVLFRLLTSQLPFTADSGIAMVQRQLHDPPTPVRNVRSELPEACDEILSRALEKVATNRYQTADEFRSALTKLDPNLAMTGVSRIASSVVPAPSAIAARAADAESALPATSTPAGASAADVAPVTVVLPRSDGAGLSVPARRKVSPAAIAASVVVLAGIPGVLVLRSQQPAPAASAALTAASLPSSTSSAPSSIAASANAPPAAEATIAPAKPSTDAKSASFAPGVKKAAMTSPAPAAAIPEPARPALPVAVFSRIRLLVLGQYRPRDRDATLRLASDGFEVLDGTRAIESASWQDVIGLYYSHSKEPRWTNADGQSGPLVKTGGGLGFLKATPDWITLRTTRNFVPLRVREEDVARLTTELETRTGAKIVTAK